MAKKTVSARESDSEARSTNAIDRHLGERVRTTRLERQMSQETLAGILGVTFQQVQKYEKSTNRIAASRLYDIALALKVPVSYFFIGLAKTGKEGAGEELGQSRQQAIARQITDHANHIVTLSEKLGSK